MGLVIGVGSTRPAFPYDAYYGIQWSIQSSGEPTRIGKTALHNTLPIQSLMRRCLLKDDGTVNYYLDANDSTKTTTGANAVLDGSDGQVMVEIPDMYVRFEQDGDVQRCLMSTFALPGFKKWSKDYVGAYEATVQRTGNKLCSVVNTTADFRGCGNQSEWDGTYRSALGLPASAISPTNYRAYARNRGASGETKWNMMLYQQERKLFWLFAVEYCTFNSQKAFNASLTAEGFRQGGLGNGVTNIISSQWNAYNGYYPFIPCGYTNSLGNKTGVVPFSFTEEQAEAYGGAFTTSVPSYRGVENPFGHIFKWVDGTKILIQSNDDGGKSLFYTCDDPSMFNTSASELTGYTYIGALPRTSGYIKSILFGDNGDIMPKEVGGGSTTYFCDFFYTDIPASGFASRALCFGGLAHYGALAGFVYSRSNYSWSNSSAHIGSRLCFIP